MHSGFICTLYVCLCVWHCLCFLQSTCRYLYHGTDTDTCRWVHIHINMLQILVAQKINILQILVNIEQSFYLILNYMCTANQFIKILPRHWCLRFLTLPFAMVPSLLKLATIPWTVRPCQVISLFLIKVRVGFQRIQE